MTVAGGNTDLLVVNDSSQTRTIVSVTRGAGGMATRTGLMPDGKGGIPVPPYSRQISTVGHNEILVVMDHSGHEQADYRAQGETNLLDLSK